MSPKKSKKKPKRRTSARTSANAPSDQQKTAKAEPGYKFPMHRLPLIILFFLITFGGASIVLMRGGKTDVQELGYEVVAEYVHDADAFTQGLYFDGEYLYESTGNPRNLPEELQSSIRKVNLKTGVPEKLVTLDDKYFGEGLAKVDDRFIQLTYKSRVAFIYDSDLNKIDEIKYEFAEGWGLTYDGTNLIVSDGTSNLKFLDPETLKVQRELIVRTGKRRLPRINELEYIQNRIYANVWHDDSIYIINPKSGLVESRVDLTSLLPRDQRRNNEAVLNGIAVNSKSGTLYVTGKLWPKLYEIKLKEK